MADQILVSKCAEGMECPTASDLLKLTTIIKGDNGDYSKSILGRMQTLETYVKISWALIVLVMPFLTAWVIKIFNK